MSNYTTSAHATARALLNGPRTGIQIAVAIGRPYSSTAGWLRELAKQGRVVSEGVRKPWALTEAGVRFAEAVPTVVTAGHPGDRVRAVAASVEEEPCSTAEDVAADTGFPIEEVRVLLNEASRRGMVVRSESRGVTLWTARRAA